MALTPQIAGGGQSGSCLRAGLRTRPACRVHSGDVGDHTNVAANATMVIATHCRLSSFAGEPVIGAAS